MTAQRLATIIQQHGTDAYVTGDGQIRAYESATDRNGNDASHWVTLPANVQAVRDWLGY